MYVSTTGHQDLYIHSSYIVIGFLNCDIPEFIYYPSFVHYIIHIYTNNLYIISFFFVMLCVFSPFFMAIWRPKISIRVTWKNYFGKPFMLFLKCIYIKHNIHFFRFNEGIRWCIYFVYTYLHMWIHTHNTPVCMCNEKTRFVFNPNPISTQKAII